MTGISVGVRYGFLALLAPLVMHHFCAFFVYFLSHFLIQSLTAQLLNLTEVKPHEYSHL
jgi:hypothetical protein